MTTNQQNLQKSNGRASDVVPPEEVERRPPGYWRRVESWIARYERRTLIAATLITGLVWGFLKLADYVGGGEPHALDRALIEALRSPTDLSDPWGPRWFEETVRDVTALGGIGVLVLVCLSVLGYLLVVRKRATALTFALSVGIGMALSLFLKEAFDRPRPDLVPHGMHVLTKSFPSGHSMMAAVCYLTIGALLVRVLPGRRETAYVLGITIALTLLVGVSRIYLGVHWPTDVLAGWAAGGAWAILAWTLTRGLQRKGKIETAPEDVGPPIEDISTFAQPPRRISPPKGAPASPRAE